MDTPKVTGEESSFNMPPGPGRKRRSFAVRLVRGCAMALPIILIATWIFGSMIVSRIIDWQLKSQLASRVNAKLETGSVRYLFPYGVRIEKAHFVVPDTAEGRGWGIDVGRLELTLAKLPLGGPLVIQSLDIDDPVVRLSAADPAPSSTAGTQPVTPLARQPTASPSRTPSGPTKKLSDLFQLRRVTLNDARIEFDPGTTMQHKPPVIWEHLNANLITTPLAGGDYKFSFQAKDEPLAIIDADGAFDIDSLLLDMQKLSVAVQVDPVHQAVQLPPVIQTAFKKFKIGGQVKLEAIAKVALDDPAHGVYAATLSLANGTGQVPSLEKPISTAQFTLKCSNLAKTGSGTISADLPSDLSKTPRPLRVWVAGLKVGSDKKLVRIDDGEISFDPSTGNWSVQNLRGDFDTGGSTPIVDLNANGSIDTTTMVMDVQKFLLAVQCDLDPVAAKNGLTQSDPRHDPEPQAGQLLSTDETAGYARPVLLMGKSATSPSTDSKGGTASVVANPPKRKVKFAGRVALDMIGRLPLKMPSLGLFSARLSLVDGVGEFPGVPGQVAPATVLIFWANQPVKDHKSLPIQITGNLPASPMPVRVWIDDISGANDKQRVHLVGGEGTVDLATLSWNLSHLTGVIDAGNAPGVIRDANVVTHLPVTLSSAGRFVSDGSGFGLDEKSYLDLAIAKGLVDATKDQIPFRNIEGVIEAHPHEAFARRLTGTSMGGKLVASAEYFWGKRGATQKRIMTYFGSIDIKDLDLHKVSIVFTSDESLRARTTGVMDFSLRYHGLIIPDAPDNSPDSVANRLLGAGDFDVRKGYFTTIPVLKDILGMMQNVDAATIGEAAGTFTVADQVVTFQQAAASSPAIGVTGNGTIHFDQTVDMIFVATPLADWRADIKSSGNSFFDGLADAAGKVQGALNNFQAKHIYQIKVTGPITGPPAVSKVFLPGVGEEVGGFFQKMSGQMQDNGVFQELKHGIGQ